MVSSSTHNGSGVQHVVISDDIAGQRLDNFLLSYVKGVPKTRLYRAIRKGEVRINGSRTQPSYRLQTGDNVRIPPLRVAKREPKTLLSRDQARAEDLNERIIYEDRDLIVLNKPTGIAVHGGSGLSFGVIESLRAVRPNEQLELVHRLDKDTSGCLVIAKRKSALRAIHSLLRSGQVQKTYLAVVKGQWRGGDSITAPLLKQVLQSGERIVRVSEQGQASQTDFDIVDYFPSSTLLSVKPITGRTHQIRVHTAFVGNPILGDVKYGNEAFNERWKKLGLERLFLHASQIAFQLPQANAPLVVSAPVDKQWAEGIKQLSGER